MKLLLRRDQKPGMMGLGKVTFILDVRSELTDEEQANVKKYKLGDTVVYEKIKVNDPGMSGVIGLGVKFAVKMMNLTITVENLVKGKTVECKDVVELLAAEEQIKEASETFKAVLTACTHFGGEEVIEY